MLLEEYQSCGVKIEDDLGHSVNRCQEIKALQAREIPGCQGLARLPREPGLCWGRGP
jgi:hypothetical protein